VKKRLEGEGALLVASYAVAGRPLPVEEGAMARVPASRDPQKGFEGARWSAMLGLGAQRFLDAGARGGLFPPASLLGLELSARDDLGHGLAWGVDAAAGGGTSTLRLPGLDPLRVRFTELSGGASLWKEWRLGRLGLQGGLRVAFVWLARAFPPGEGLPGQYFFTVAPGLTGAAAWRLTPRLSAVARLRVSWLFYNVDQDRSLGFTDALLGVEYALTD